MKFGLLQDVSVFRAYKAMPPRATITCHAVTFRVRFQVATTPWVIVSVYSERIDPTSRQSELVLTRIARDRAFVLKWQFNCRGIGQGTPIIVPKAVLGIHQDPKRRRCNGLCLGHPALKRQEGRATHCRP